MRALLDEGIVGVIEDLHHDFHGDPEGFGDMRFYVDEARIITIRRRPLRAVDLLRRRLERGVCMGSASEWLVHFVEALAESFGSEVTELVTQVDAIEDDIVDGDGQTARGALANLRRLLVRVRRHVHADRMALTALRAREEDPHALSPLRRALEHVDGVAQDLDLVLEVAQARSGYHRQLICKTRSNLRIEAALVPLGLASLVIRKIE